VDLAAASVERPGDEQVTVHIEQQAIGRQRPGRDLEIAQRCEWCTERGRPAVHLHPEERCTIHGHGQHPGEHDAAGAWVERAGQVGPVAGCADEAGEGQ